LGSENSLEDRKKFMTQVFLFWVLGATDGHAKNFSIFLLPNGSFHLTPAYDIISADPILKSKREIVMAMAARGKNRHRKWNGIFQRHWLSTAKKCKFPESEMSQIMDRIVGDMDRVIDTVGNNLPENFPDNVAAPIFDGMKSAKESIG